MSDVNYTRTTAATRRAAKKRGMNYLHVSTAPIDTNNPNVRYKGHTFVRPRLELEKSLDGHVAAIE